MNNIVENPTNNPEFKKIVCRRIPIKLKQFARLLAELTTSELDPVRVKAMNSQMNRTREVCLEYHIESTAKLLANIQSQLHLEQDTFVFGLHFLHR